MPFMFTLAARLRAMDKTNRFSAALVAVFVLASATFMINYHRPSGMFWDENYYLTAVQKYTDGYVFFESHPPLGKLFMALGENVFGRNDHLDRSAFTLTEKIDTVPKGYSFIGVRFFPVLFAVLGAVLFFLILNRLIGKPFFAFIFSGFYVFENAFILHSRGAMLDSTQLFFIFAAIALFIRYTDSGRPLRQRQYFGLGAVIGLAIMVKLNAAFLLLLFPVLFLYEHRASIRERWFRQRAAFWLDLLKKTAVSAGAIALVAFAVFMVHFSLGDRIPGGQTQKISPEYRSIIARGETGNIFNFPIMLRDYVAYMSSYHENVPKFRKYDESDNGSRPITWPFGEKSIRYRWNKTGGHVQYLYLQGNPVIWISGLIGLALAFALVSGRLVFRHRPEDAARNRLFWYIAFFFGLYAIYMAMIMRIDRVMYLYHYFIPLFFSLFLAALVFAYIFREKVEQGDRVLMIGCGIFFIEILAAFVFFMPLTYYFPLTTREFLQRTWLDIWELKYVQ